MLYETKTALQDDIFEGKYVFRFSNIKIYVGLMIISIYHKAEALIPQIVDSIPIGMYTIGFVGPVPIVMYTKGSVGSIPSEL